MKNLREEIEKIPAKDFYAAGITEVELEGYGDEATYIIPMHINIIRDAYYGFDCLEHIRENDEWQVDKAWIREYFLNHLSEIEIYGDD